VLVNKFFAPEVFMSVHKNSRFGEAFTKADLHFRLGFAQLLEAGMKAADDPNTALLNSRLKLKYSLRQGNAAAIRDSSKGAGWIDEPYAAALFEELGVPYASQLANAYKSLKEAVEGKTEKTYRDNNDA